MRPHYDGPRCGCGDPIPLILFEGKHVCSLCALLLVGDHPATRYLELIGERREPGLLIGRRPVRQEVSA